MGPERHGRVRGYGLGPTPTSIFGSTSTQYRTNLEAMRVELNTVHARMEEMQKKHEEDRRAYLEHMEKQQEWMRATMAEMMMQIPSQQQNPSQGVSLLIYCVLLLIVCVFFFLIG